MYFYTENDILKISKVLKKKKDYDYWFNTINMLRKRYLLNPNWIEKELPQEMFLSIALFLSVPEWLYKIKNYILWNNKTLSENDILEIEKIIKKWLLTENDKEILLNEDIELENILKLSKDLLLSNYLIKKRLEVTEKIYEYISELYISLPTPTLMNARTNKHQLSSCFKLNVDDDLRWIYHSFENIAQISKFGWWIWTYLWHIRSKGSAIRWIKWASWWVLP